MPSAAHRNACKSAEFPPSLRHRLLTPMVKDGPAIAAVWFRYLADRNAADFSRLCDHYTPIAWMDVSDGLLGMIQQIQLAESFAEFYTFSTIRRAVRRAIWNEMRARSWSGRRRAEQLQTVQRIRGELTRELGRVPDKNEIIVRLADQVTNPNIYIPAIEDVGTVMNNPSQWDRRTRSGEIEHAMKNIADHKSGLPIDAVLGGEAMRVAMKRMKGVDRKIFRLLLAGHEQSVIADKVGLSRTTVHQRLNGLLWTARCNAELAAYLGVEPDPALPARSANRHYPAFKAEPARRVG
jgi:DNA-directed RNA polymerase specialized sigma subunit